MKKFYIMTQRGIVAAKRACTQERFELSAPYLTDCEIHIVSQAIYDHVEVGDTW